MTDLLVERLTYAPAPFNLKAIPWPTGLAPKALIYNAAPDTKLPTADVVCITYTSAEKQAMADVLVPGRSANNWNFYAEDFTSYEPDLTWRSPAKEVNRLGEYTMTQIGSKRVLCFHSQLHLATDSMALPYRRLVAQIIRETGCGLLIDTGTAGGIGADVVEGDTIVGQNLVFDCTGFLKDEPYAHESFPCTYDTSGIDFSQAEQLMAVNAAGLRPEATRDPKVWKSDVITCDSFLFDDVEDSFGLETYDNGHALVEEMDAATIGLTAQDLGSAMPPFTSLRSVSDPRMPNLGSVEREKSAASVIYRRFGGLAQAATLCAVWQVIVDL